MSGQRARFSDGATIRSPSSLVESTKLNDERRKLRFPNRFSKTSTFVGTRRKEKEKEETSWKRRLERRFIKLYFYLDPSIRSTSRVSVILS